jgi:putative transposase
MTVLESIDPARWLSEQAGAGDTDVLRAMVTAFANAVMSADADTVCGAGYGQRSDDRTNSRNGYRAREWDTRAGTVELQIPKLRTGSYFPDWLLEHRRRAEQALVTVVATSYLLGVSTRRVEKLAEQLGVTRLSKSQVSEMATHLDTQVEAFRSRPLDSAFYTFVALDALTMKVREAGRTVNVACLVAVGVNADGHREVLGLDICAEEDGAGWLAFLRSLTARGLSGVRLVISDAHRGLINAIGSALPGAAWQRCRTHYLRNLLTRVPKSAQPWLATLVRTIFDQPDADAVRAQFARVVDTITTKYPDAADHLAARDDLLAFTAFTARDLEADLVEQPAGTPEQGDLPPDRRGRDLPQPRRRHPPRRRRPGRADRRVDRTTPLHGPGTPGQSTQGHRRRHTHRHPGEDPAQAEHRRLISDQNHRRLSVVTPRRWT